jgi:hypothetical protein
MDGLVARGLANHGVRSKSFGDALPWVGCRPASRWLCRTLCNTIQSRPINSQSCSYPARPAAMAFEIFFLRQETFGRFLASTRQMR